MSAVVVNVRKSAFLILVVMEYALGVAANERCSTACAVLILVVMEYALGEGEVKVVPSKIISLNPCCDGICSRRADGATKCENVVIGLNPCCDGICSRRAKSTTL